MNEVQQILNERFLLQEEYLGKNKPINLITPLVSITVPTFQHVKYIGQCLDGILTQKTNFNFEIILGEDGSSDGTRELCISYADKYPDKIRLFLRDRNMSHYYDKSLNRTIRFNGIWNRMSIRGKYMAWCDGDDYWTDPLKLQKQVDFLENNSDYGIVHTGYTCYWQDYNSKYIPSKHLKKDLDFIDLLRCNKIAALTVVALTEAILQAQKDIASNKKQWAIGDYPLWLEISKKYKIKYLKDNTAVYRRNIGSVSNSNNINGRISFEREKIDIVKFYGSTALKAHSNRIISQIITNSELTYILNYSNSYLDGIQKLKQIEFRYHCFLSPRIILKILFITLGLNRIFKKREFR